jgi:hypothetical protein
MPSYNIVSKSKSHSNTCILPVTCEAILRAILRAACAWHCHKRLRHHLKPVALRCSWRHNHILDIQRYCIHVLCACVCVCVRAGLDIHKSILVKECVMPACSYNVCSFCIHINLNILCFCMRTFVYVGIVFGVILFFTQFYSGTSSEYLYPTHILFFWHRSCIT